MSSDVLHHRKVAIFGAPKGKVGAGLISSLADLPDNEAHQPHVTERLKVAAQRALGRWRSARPDWNFKLVEIPRRTDGYYGPDFKSIDAFYEMDLNA